VERWLVLAATSLLLIALTLALVTLPTQPSHPRTKQRIELNYLAFILPETMDIGTPIAAYIDVWYGVATVFGESGAAWIDLCLRKDGALMSCAYGAAHYDLQEPAWAPVFAPQPIYNEYGMFTGATITWGDRVITLTGSEIVISSYVANISFYNSWSAYDAYRVGVNAVLVPGSYVLISNGSGYVPYTLQGIEDAIYAEGMEGTPLVLANHNAVYVDTGGGYYSPINTKVVSIGTQCLERDLINVVVVNSSGVIVLHLPIAWQNVSIPGGGYRLVPYVDTKHMAAYFIKARTANASIVVDPQDCLAAIALDRGRELIVYGSDQIGAVVLSSSSASVRGLGYGGEIDVALEHGRYIGAALMSSLSSIEWRGNISVTVVDALMQRIRVSLGTAIPLLRPLIPFGGSNVRIEMPEQVALNLNTPENGVLLSYAVPASEVVEQPIAEINIAAPIVGAKVTVIAGFHGEIAHAAMIEVKVDSVTKSIVDTLVSPTVISIITTLGSGTHILLAYAAVARYGFWTSTSIAKVAVGTEKSLVFSSTSVPPEVTSSKSSLTSGTLPSKTPPSSTSLLEKLLEWIKKHMLLILAFLALLVIIATVRHRVASKVLPQY